MSFAEISELVEVLSRKKIPLNELFTPQAVQEDEARVQLYQGIKAGRFSNDDDASRKIFGSKANNEKYRKLRSRLRQHLINVVLNLDLAGDRWSSQYQKASQEVTRAVTQVKQLLRHGATATATELCGHYLQMAIDHDLTESVVSLSRLLRTRSVYAGDTQNFERYRDLYLYYSVRLEAEQRSELLMDEASLRFIHSADDGTTDTEFLVAIEREMLSLRSAHPTFAICLNSYRISCWLAHTQHDHTRAQQVCEQALEYLSANPQLSSKTRVADFAYMQMNELHIQCKFKEAEKTAQICRENFVVNGSHWFAFHSIWFNLAMHTANYARALEIFRLVDVPALKLQPKHIRERWQVFAGFLLWMHQCSVIHLEQLHHERLRSYFKPERFSFVFRYDLNVYLKDTTGFYINIILLEFLFALDKGFESVRTLHEKLRKYYFRKLRDGRHPRAEAFFHLVLILFQEDFNPERARERAAKEQRLLAPTEATPLPGEGSEKSGTALIYMEGWEIIRYEQLWDLILRRLDHLTESGVYAVVTNSGSNSPKKKSRAK